MSNIIAKESYPYLFDSSACATCLGRCCTGESGYIYVTKEEIKNIAEVLKIGINELRVEYLYKKASKYSIREFKNGDSYECAFYDRESNVCKIYNARPNQCKTFPFWEYYKSRVRELKEECPGIIDE